MKKKYLVQLQNDFENKGNKIITRHEEIFDSENFKSEILEIEDIEINEDEYKELVFNKDSGKVEFVAKKIQKTDIQIAQEKLEATMKAVEDLIDMLGNE